MWQPEGWTAGGVQIMREQAAEFEAGYPDAMASGEAVVLTQSGLLKTRYDSPGLGTILFT